MSEDLKKLINNNNKKSGTTANAQETTAYYSPLNVTPTTAGTSVTTSYSLGWRCPVCGAVMSPWTSSCINCHGNYPYPQQPWWVQPWWTPYCDTVTCTSPKITFTSTTTTKEV